MPFHGYIFHITGLLWVESTSHWFPSKMSDNAKLWSFLACMPEHTVEQTVELPIIWLIMKLMWYHCNDKIILTIPPYLLPGYIWPVLDIFLSTIVHWSWKKTIFPVFHWYPRNFGTIDFLRANSSLQFSMEEQSWNSYQIEYWFCYTGTHKIWFNLWNTME